MAEKYNDFKVKSGLQQCFSNQAGLAGLPRIGLFFGLVLSSIG